MFSFSGVQNMPMVVSAGGIEGHPSPDKDGQVNVTHHQPSFDLIQSVGGNATAVPLPG